jgi:hypothetical protein
MSSYPPVHYFVVEKNRHHGEAIVKGFKADVVPAADRALRSGALHLIGGLGHGSLELMQHARMSRYPYVFFDRAYFNGGPGTDRLRVVPDAYQKSWITENPSDRFLKTGVYLKPWRKDGAHIILVPPSKAVTALFDFGPLFENMYWRLERLGRPVIVSEKGKDKASDHFEGAHCVVTWTSNVAVEAVCAGVPVFTSNHSAAAPMAGMLENMELNIDNPPMRDREAWAASLAYGEFDLSEIASGFAAETIQRDARK